VTLWGRFLPNDAFMGGAPSLLLLDIDTSQIPSYFHIECTFTSTDFTCTTGPLGQIRLEWRQNGLFRSMWSQTNSSLSLNLPLTVNQNADVASATTTGAFIGLSIENGFGQAGINHNSTLNLNEEPLIFKERTYDAIRVSIV